MSENEGAARIPARVLAAICRAHWAIAPEALETILEVARREGDLRAVEARLGRPLQNSYAVTVRQGVAVLPVRGPIFRYANIFTELSGATSIDLLARDLRAALDDNQVRAVMLDIDSPGGQVAGTAEFAQMVRDGSAEKPIVAYSGDGAASAAYWIASAAPRLVVGRTADVGSIGVVAGLRRGRDENTIEIVSSQSPRKRPDIETDEGRSQIQAVVDRLADEFVAAVARYRGVTTDKVLSDFGGGGLLIGADAVAAGMADQVGSFEEVLAELAAAGSGSPKSAAAAAKEIRMTEESGAAAAPPVTAERVTAEAPEVAEQFRTAGATAERERVLALLQVGENAPGHMEAVMAAVRDGKSSAGDLAQRILATERETRTARLDALRKADDKVQVPASGTATGVGGEEAADVDPLSEEGLKVAWNKDAKLRTEFGGDFNTFAAFRRRSADGRARIYREEARA